MIPKGVGVALQVVAVAAVMVSALMVYRLNRVDSFDLKPGYNYESAVENYEQRLRETQRMLRRDVY
uniref:Uncharacterized protein n=1 Tax=candidate division WOR-3 bacterium TaxID=2052148 RepID=A0A7C4CDG3_UNCW3